MDLPQEFQFAQAARFALVVAEPPKNPPAYPPFPWQQFVGSLLNIEPPSANTKKIHDNFWLIHLNDDMLFLAEIFVLAKKNSIVLRILFLHEEPAWIKYPPDAATAPESA